MFTKKKRDAKWQAESIRLEEEMAKARARVKIYEDKNHDQEMVLKLKNIYKAITYHQQTTKHSEINQHSDPANVGIQNVHSSIPQENYDQNFDKINIQCGFRQAS